METSKPRGKSPAEVEDIILKKILMVSLDTDSITTRTDTRVVYLETMAAQILSEDKDLKLSRVLVERVLMDRLSGDFPSAEPPLDYLIGVFRRAHEQGKKIVSMKDQVLRAEMELLVQETKRLAIRFCATHLANPNMFPDHSERITKPDAYVSPLLPLIFPSCVDGAFTNSGPGFFDEVFRVVSDPEILEPIVKQLYEDLMKTVRVYSVLGNFQPALRALMCLASCPVGAKCLASHPQWVPNGDDHGPINGRDIEMRSILGPFFHVSAIPDPIFESQPDVAELCFPEPSRIWYSSVDKISPFVTIRTPVNYLYDGLHKLLLSLLKNKNTKESILRYIAEVINKNKSRARTQVDPVSCASSGMFVNLSAVMLRLFAPFLGADWSKLGKIDPFYVLRGSRLDLKELTAVNASSSEIIEWLTNPFSQLLATSSGNTDNDYPFICESFFMTARVLHLGLLKAFSEFADLEEDISRCEEALASLKAIPERAHDITRLEEEIESLRRGTLCYEAQIVKDEDLIRRALEFYRLMVNWLVGLAGGSRMSLTVPPACPKKFAFIPEHFVEDIIDFLIFSSKIPKALDGVILDEFVNFIVMFMGSPECIRSPYLRAKMVNVLKCWMKSDSVSTSSILFNVSGDYLVRNLLKLYADIESTGSNAEFYDKFSIRHNVNQVLEYLWRVPVQQNSWKQIAKEEEKGIYLNFLNFLINDSIFLLDESLNKILELKGIETEMSNQAEWERRPAQERSERTGFLRKLEKIIKIDVQLAMEDLKILAFTTEQITSPFLLPEMVDRVAGLLNYFLLQLVGPKRKLLTIKNKEKYMFEPKKLLKQIVIIYVHLARGDEGSVFATAVAKDGQCYNDELFAEAVKILGTKCTEDVSGHIVNEFDELGKVVKALASKAIDFEAALGDIPQEFLDPIQCTLMMDPVILPVSNATMDRAVIQRHLLSKRTDPFNRSHLTADMLVPNTEMKAKIEEFIRSKQMTSKDSIIID